MAEAAAAANRPHVVCVAFPAQSHIKGLLKLAKLLNCKGCHITFVNTEFNHKRFIKARGPNSLDGLPGFRFETIPDGLPPSEANATQDIPALCQSTRKHCLAPFLDLLAKLKSSLDSPLVTSIVSDGFMTFAIDAAEQHGIPIFLYWKKAANSFMGFYHLQYLKEKGLIPLKDESYLTNGYLDTIVDWIPGMKGIRLRDLPSFVRTTNMDHIVLNFCIEGTQRATKASGIILHTFDALELDLVNALRYMFPGVYTIGPQQLLLNQMQEKEQLKSIGYNLWKEEQECLEWLDSQKPNSVIYVSFGSITVMGAQELMEFGWGLANSNYYYLWVIRPDLVVGESPHTHQNLLPETKEKGFITSWCPQEQVLNHPSVGGFLNNGGGTSIMEGISAGVPMICWPNFGDQPTGCRYVCTEWGIGMELDHHVKRDKVERLVKELMGGDKGKKMKSKVMEWKKLAQEATGLHGSSTLSLEKLVINMSTI